MTTETSADGTTENIGTDENMTTTDNVSPATDTISETETAPPLIRPRIRFGTIMWGLLVIGAGVWLLTAFRTAPQREQIAEWFFSLTPSDGLLISAIILGSTMLILGLLAAIRSHQKRTTGE